MTAQLELFDALDGVPMLPGHYRQAGVAFTALGGDKKGQLVHHTSPRGDVDWLRWYADFVRERQAAMGVTPDARLQWREVTCGEWQDE
jgi:hypothetical protein